MPSPRKRTMVAMPGGRLFGRPHSPRSSAGGCWRGPGFAASPAGTVAEFLERWLASAEAKVQERTFVRYDQIVRTHLIPDLGSIKLAQLRPLHIERTEAAFRQLPHWSWACASERAPYPSVSAHRS